MDWRATKHMTSHRVIFDIYEVIYEHSMHLGDDSMVEAIEMESVVVGVETRGKTRIHITNMLHMSKLQANLLSISNFFVQRVEDAISRKQMHCGRCKWPRGCNSLTYKEFIPNDLHKGMRNKCSQLHTFICERWSDDVLTPPTQSFGCDEHLCTPKHVEGHDPR